MYRYVHIGDQIDEDCDQFAFFDTKSNQFLCFAGQEVFDDPDDFALYASDDYRYDRCVSLIPSPRTIDINPSGPPHAITP